MPINNNCPSPFSFDGGFFHAQVFISRPLAKGESMNKKDDFVQIAEFYLATGWNVIVIASYTCILSREVTPFEGFILCVESQFWLDLFKALRRGVHVVEDIGLKGRQLGSKLLACSCHTEVSSFSFIVSTVESSEVFLSFITYFTFADPCDAASNEGRPHHCQDQLECAAHLLLLLLLFPPLFIRGEGY